MENQGLLHGRLEEVRFPEVILQISKRKQTGVLHILRHQIEKNVFFNDGRVVFAQSSDLDERLGEVLLRLGKVTCRQVEDSVKKIAPGKRLGTVLVEQGFISASDLYHGVIRQVEEILYDVFDWSDGEYEFRPGNLPTQEVITLNISTPDVILTGMSRIWRSSWIMKGVGPLDTVVRRTEGWSDIVKKLSIPQKVKPVLEMLEHPTRLEDFLPFSPLSNFETCKWIWAFSIIGVVQQDRAIPVIQDQAIPVIALNPVQAEIRAETDTISFDVDSEPFIEVIDEERGSVSDEAGRESSFSGMEASMDTTPTVSGLLSRQTLTEAEEVALRDQEIQNLNEKQRFVFERLRFEMGASVGNFLSKILRKVCGKYPLLFESVEINEFGELDTTSLNHNIEGNMFENYREAFAYFIDEQQRVIGSFLDRKTIEAIEAGLKRIDEEQNQRRVKSNLRSRNSATTH
jgi:hypothetical protein